MKIHTNVLVEDDVINACHAAGMRGVYADELDTKGSRSRKRALIVKLVGNSNRAVNPGTSRYADRGADAERAATWDEWGMFINALYQKDPEAIVGDYQSKAHFEAVTRGRYGSLTAPYAHGNHKWEYGTDGVRRCKFCEAEFDYKAEAPAA